MFEQSRKSEKSVLSGRTGSKSDTAPDPALIMKQLKRNMTGSLQMLTEDEEKEKMQRKSQKDKELQMKNDPASPGSKSQMPEDVKSKMENSFGTDFSNVNIHKDSDQATNIGALAYTQGSDVHFAPGQYEPGSTKGQELLGHELTHVVQQREGRVKPDTEQHKGLNINSDTTLEKEADDMGALAAQGKMANVRGSGNGVQKANADSQKQADMTNIFASEKVKEEYIDNTKHRLTQSQGSYGDAILEVKNEINTAAAKVPSVASIFVEIGFGFLVPGAGKLLSRMVNNISSKAPDFLFAAALAVQNENITGPILGGLGSVAKTEFSNLLVSDAVKCAKAQSSFADILYQKNGEYVQSVRESIKIETPDIQILSLYHTYDFEITNKESYKKSIRETLSKFKEDILEIDQPTSILANTGSTTAFNKLVYIDNKLAMVQEHNDYNFLLRIWDSLTGSNTSHYYLFDHWISPEMESIAITKAGGTSKVPKLSKSDVGGIK